MFVCTYSPTRLVNVYCCFVLQRQLGCSFLSALLVEYSSSSGSSNIGMPLEFHSECKRAVEVSLSRSFDSGVLVSQLPSSASRFTVDFLHFFSQLTRRRRYFFDSFSLLVKFFSIT